VFRDLAADRDGDADVPRRPRRDARARRDPRGGRLRDERTPDRDSRRDPRGRAAAHAPRGESIDERAVGEFAFDARLVDLRPLEPREAITAEELPEPNVLDPAVDLLVFRTGWAAHWGPIGTATTRT